MSSGSSAIAHTGELLTVLRADPHQFGPGKVHIFENGQTLCGKPREHCPGELRNGRLDQITCKVCRRSRESRERFAEQQAQWEQRQAERDRENREWWAWYDGYLQTPEWRQRRALVLRRANGTCEGCGRRPATQVHHLTYERVGAEMLFDLAAVCNNCHSQVHKDRGEWT